MIHSVKGTVATVKKCKLVDPGSKSCLAEFVLKNPVIALLEKACSQLNLMPEDDGYLGGGAFGFVFRVKNQNQSTLALKISTDHDAHLTLDRQMEYTKCVANICPHLVVDVEEDGFRLFENLGACLLFSEVGEHYSSLSKKKIIDSLVELHTNGVFHGDACLENVVCVDGEAKWIDFQKSLVSSSPDSMPKFRAETDMTALLQSIADSRYFS